MMRFMLVLLAFLPLPALAAPQVVATIAPLAGIAAAVQEGVASPGLLIRNNASPHTYQLKPSDAALLAEADLVLWVGPGMEASLAGKLGTLAPKARLLGIMDEDAGQHHLPVRAGTAWEPEVEDDEDHHEHHHDHGADDPHAWLNPDNAIVLAGRLAEALAQLDPAHAAVYRANAARFEVDTRKLDAELKQQLTPLAGRGFIVFHDAYQYFEQRYHLKAIGAISLSPEVPPSPQRLAQLQQRLASEQAVCVFAEPQFSRALVDTLVAKTSLRTGVLNPDASDLPVTPQLYGAYMRRLAQAFAECLG